MRIVILGNSGSGKSTLARWLGARGDASVLDLDTVAWEPGQIAVAREPAAAAADVRSFCNARDRWVVEGCYGSLARVALAPVAPARRPLLIFLDPGLETCLAHCRARPWEPHKYASRQEQDARLAALLEWVRGYDTRAGDLGRADHVALFDAYAGPRLRLVQPLDLSHPPGELLDRLATI